MRMCNIIHTVRCDWCRGVISKKKVGKEKPVASWDTVDRHTSSRDYHEECWNEAIEVEI